MKVSSVILERDNKKLTVN